MHLDQHDATVDAVAAGLGLARVGWIFSDLAPDDLQRGTVQHTRTGSARIFNREHQLFRIYRRN